MQIDYMGSAMRYVIVLILCLMFVGCGESTYRYSGGCDIGCVDDTCEEEDDE